MQLAHHASHKWESLQSFKAERGFIELVVHDFTGLRRLHRF
jgi:hypothetical protein